MTLTSRVRVREPLSPRQVHEWATALVAQGRTPRPTEPRDYDGMLCLWNEPQDFLARIITYWHPDGPLPVEDPDDPDGRMWGIAPAGCVGVAIDTPYSYRADNGAGCDDLHAWIIAELGKRIDAAGSDWCWYYEHDGDWYPGHTIMPSGDDSAQLYVLGDAERGAPCSG
jgi:hypothetical protein